MRDGNLAADLVFERDERGPVRATATDSLRSLRARTSPTNRTTALRAMISAGSSIVRTRRANRASDCMVPPPTADLILYRMGRPSAPNCGGFVVVFRLSM